MDKFDDLPSSEVLQKYKEYGLEYFNEADRPQVLKLLMEHEKNIKIGQIVLKIILALFSLIPTILLWLNNI